MINTEPRAKIRSSTTPAQLRRGGVGGIGENLRAVLNFSEFCKVNDILLQGLVVLKTARM